MAQEQQIQETKPAQAAVKPNQTQSVETGSKWYKKWWIWVIVVVILGAAGYWFFIR